MPKVYIDHSVAETANDRVKRLFDTQSSIARAAMAARPEMVDPNIEALNALLLATTRNATGARDQYEQETNPERYAARKKLDTTLTNYQTVPDQTKKDMARLGLWAGASAGGVPRAGSVNQSVARSVYGRGSDAEEARRLGVTSGYMEANPQQEVSLSPSTTVQAVSAANAANTQNRNARLASLLQLMQDQQSQGFDYSEGVMNLLSDENKNAANARTQISSQNAARTGAIIQGVATVVGGVLTGGVGGLALGSMLGGMAGNVASGGASQYNPSSAVPGLLMASATPAAAGSPWGRLSSWWNSAPPAAGAYVPSALTPATNAFASGSSFYTPFGK